MKLAASADNLEEQQQLLSTEVSRFNQSDCLQCTYYMYVCCVCVQLVKKEETLEQLQSEDKALQQRYEACCEQVNHA